MGDGTAGAGPAFIHLAADLTQGGEGHWSVCIIMKREGMFIPCKFTGCPYKDQVGTVIGTGNLGCDHIRIQGIIS
ncbi:hypothetical protein D3C86_2122270 [compost metagenome]